MKSWRDHTVEHIVVDGPAAIVGDIHGRVDLLSRLLDEIGDTPLFVAGDVVDRGPDPRGVIDLLQRVGARGVRGNHEEWFTAWTCGEGIDRIAFHWAMGGIATLKSYGIDLDDIEDVEDTAEVPCPVPAAHRRWVQGLPLAVDLVVEGQPWWLLHAGIPHPESLTMALEDTDDLLPPEALEEMVPWLARHRRLTLLWAKTHVHEMPVVDRPVIFGHVPDTMVRDEGHAICIDTGCGTFADGALTALLLPERRLVRVE